MLKKKNSDFNGTMLSRGVSVGSYRKFVQKKDKKKITQFIYERFFERYISPLESIPKDKKNGFCIMANCCLMIEVLESFYQGWDKTNKKSRQAFNDFMNRAQEFSDFKPYSSDFYKHVRCGILHQAETTGGWKIRRKGPIFNPENRAINATKFITNLHAYLLNYRCELKGKDWDSKLWKNLRKKMDAIIKNCEYKQVN